MNEKLEPKIYYQRAQFSGEIILVEKDEQIAPALDKIKGIPHLGFDTETRPSFKKGEFYHVSLLQLASNDHALLFRLHFLQDFSLIRHVFENPDVKKIGVAIRDDLKGLQKIFDFNPNSFIELSDLARDYQLKNFGLKGMSEEVLNLTLSKRAKLSNWESRELREDQKIYAATDAWIGRAIYQSLIK